MAQVEVRTLPGCVKELRRMMEEDQDMFITEEIDDTLITDDDSTAYWAEMGELIKTLGDIPIEYWNDCDDNNLAWAGVYIGGVGISVTAALPGHYVAGAQHPQHPQPLLLLLPDGTVDYDAQFRAMVYYELYNEFQILRSMSA